MAYEHDQFVAAIKALAIVGLVLTVIGFVLFYAFRTQRIFPASLLGWVLVGNVIASAVTLYLYAGNGGLDSFGAAVAGSPTCRVLYASNTIVISWNVCVNTFLAITLYLSVQRGISLATEDNPIYFKAFIISAFLFVVGFAVINGAFPQQPKTSCSAGRIYPIIYFVPICLLLLAQVILLGLAFQRMKTIITSVRNETSRKADRRLLLLILRFVPVIGSQFVQVVPQVVTQFASSTNAGYVTDVLFVTISIGPILDAVIVIVTNRQLWSFVRVNFLGKSGSASSFDTGESARPKENSNMSPQSMSSIHVGTL